MVKKEIVGLPALVVIRQAGQEVLKDNNAEDLTWGQFKSKLAAALDIDVLLLKVHRGPLQELVAQQTAQQEESSSDEENQHEQDSNGMTAMRAMARAMNLG